MNQTKITGWSMFALLMSSCILTTFAYPQQAAQQLQQYEPQYIEQQEYDDNRKFAEKPNAIKKVALDDIDDIQTNQLQDGGFSWSNMLGMFMQMIFAGNNNVPSKSDDLENSPTFSQSPWANVISVGLKIITALLGGGASSDGIDKVDNGGGSPMQFINIVVNLLDALKTSFSHRSLTARSIGKKDSMSDAAVAGLTMVKSYVRTYKNSEDKCMQKFICEANSDCMNAIGGSSVFCQLGTYATSFLLERQTGGSFQVLYDAGRKGRSGIDCRQLYLECNEV